MVDDLQQGLEDGLGNPRNDEDENGGENGDVNNNDADDSLSSPYSSPDGARFLRLSDLCCSAEVVDDLEGLRRARAALLPTIAVDGGSEPNASVVVGLDCEWRPYERSQEPQPVALLQVATRRQAFLLDLLRLEGPHRGDDRAGDEDVEEADDEEVEGEAEQEVEHHMPGRRSLDP